MIGICTRWDYEKSVGWAQHADNRNARTFVHATQIPEDNLGRRYLIVGEKIKFDIGFNGGDTRTMAVNVELLSPRQDDDPAEYWEEGYVERLKGPYGAIIKRPPGGWIFLHRDNAVTRIAFEEFQVWRYRVAPPQNFAVGLNWNAVDAELLGTLND
jgi:hypothetical protein